MYIETQNLFRRILDLTKDDHRTDVTDGWKLEQIQYLIVDFKVDHEFDRLERLSLESDTTRE